MGSRCAGDTTSQFSSNNRRVGAAMLPAAPRQQGSLPSSVRINNEGGAVSGFRGCWRACLLRVCLYTCLLLPRPTGLQPHMKPPSWLSGRELRHCRHEVWLLSWKRPAAQQEP